MKQRIYPVLGFKNFRNAAVTISGIELRRRSDGCDSVAVRTTRGSGWAVGGSPTRYRGWFRPVPIRDGRTRLHPAIVQKIKKGRFEIAKFMNDANVRVPEVWEAVLVG